MTARILPLLLSLVAGVAIGAFAVGSDTAPGADIAQPAAAVDDPTTNDDARLSSYDEIISSIYETLDLEIQERMRLQDEIAELQAQIADLSRNLSSAAATTGAADEKIRARARRGGVVTEETLVNAGFNDVEAVMIKRRLDEIELDQLFLRDTAVREGWMGSARYRDEVRNLTARRTGLKEELGPEGWDKYLYAIGRPNRVQVNSVLNESPAYTAGLQSGDIILSYDGQRVFNQGDVRNQTIGGAVGAMVTVEIERDGVRQQVYIPRGPLGVRLGSTIAKP